MPDRDLSPRDGLGPLLISGLLGQLAAGLSRGLAQELLGGAHRQAVAEHERGEHGIIEHP
jgi:hypothetical protein